MYGTENQRKTYIMQHGEDLEIIDKMLKKIASQSEDNLFKQEPSMQMLDCVEQDES